MELLEGIRTRKTFRGFTAEKVSKEIIQEILLDGHMAPSASNMQPWNFHVLTGTPLSELCDNIEDFHKNKKVLYNLAKDRKIPEKYMQRRNKLFKELRPVISALGDENRQFIESGSIRFYDAPILIFITTDRDLPENKLMDIGMAAENIMLSAHARGLATCAIAYTLLYSEPIKNCLNLTDNTETVLSISLGYPDNSFPINTFRSSREDLNSVIFWQGF
jgi:nitroreductase